MAEKYHDDWEVVPFNLNMEPVEDPDARALVPANTERQLEAIPILPCSTSSHRTATTPTSQEIIIQDENHHQGANRHKDPST